jgi:hypothetical protein
MLKEQLKSIKEQLGFTGKSEAIENPPKKTHVNTHKKRVNKHKVVNNSGKAKPDYNKYPMIGRPKARIENTAQVSEEKYKVEVNLQNFKRPDRSIINTLLDTNKPCDLVFSEECFSHNVAAKTQQLVIGLDFGTAFTKVVVGETTYAHAICFGDNGYLLPSMLSVASTGKCFLTEVRSGHVLSDLKLPLLLENSSKNDHIAVVSFLALVFFECRLWSEKSIYKNFNIDWLVNAGLPTKSYHDARLADLYKTILRAAWALSFCDVITIQNANAVLNQIENGNLTIPPEYCLEPDLFSLFPEFAAQIVGYVQSPSRREYSHLLIDVGAGTLDVTMFIVKNEHGDWLFQTFGKDIKTLGADILAKHRVISSNKDISIDFSHSYPNDLEFVKILGITLEVLSEIDSPFKTAVHNSIKKVVFSVAGGHEFCDDLTTFICGGGSCVDLYKEEIDLVNKTYPMKILSLPLPERLRSEGINYQNYHRFSVAYGLSFDPFNIGSVIDKKPSAKPKENYKYEPSTYLLSSE